MTQINFIEQHTLFNTTFAFGEYTTAILDVNHRVFQGLAALITLKYTHMGVLV